MLYLYYRHVKTVNIRKWMNVQDGNLKSLRRSKIGLKSLDKLAYEALINSYFAEFGMNEKMQAISNLKDKLARTQIQYLSDITKKRFLLNKIEILSNEIKKLEAEIEQPTRVVDVISTLRKQGVQIDIDKMSVYEFESLIRLDGKAN